jgi:hypothetical protein
VANFDTERDQRGWTETSGAGGTAPSPGRGSASFEPPEAGPQLRARYAELSSHQIGSALSDETKPAGTLAEAIRMTAIPMIAVVAFAEMVRFVARDVVRLVADDVRPASQHFYKAYIVALGVSFVLNYILAWLETQPQRNPDRVRSAPET